MGPAAGLRVDIANDRRLDRAEWADFLNDCRGTVGSEAGTWYLERDDRTALAIREFLREPSTGPDDPGRRMAACRRSTAALWRQGRAEGVAAALVAAARGVRSSRGRFSPKYRPAFLPASAALPGLFEMHFVAPLRGGGDRYVPAPAARPLQRYLDSRRAFYSVTGRFE